jgi:hypothetical protein
LYHCVKPVWALYTSALITTWLQLVLTSRFGQESPGRQEYLRTGCILEAAVWMPLPQWYSTGGTRRHLRGHVKFKISIYILFHE